MHRIEPATIDDIPQLLQLVNHAYRGEHSRKGWTHEADLVDGDERIDADSLHEMITRNDATILVYKTGEIKGCVYLQNQNGQLYLGMLSVLPIEQTNGIGKALMQAAEQLALQQGCASIIMSVISVRTELIQWYERRGFTLTGERQPFPSGTKVGTPKQPLEFVILEKKM
jgi:ribosomal protein S18 acetylase RimI-like enzyme